jgi:hypothetical protein
MSRKSGHRFSENDMRQPGSPGHATGRKGRASVQAARLVRQRKSTIETCGRHHRGRDVRRPEPCHLRRLGKEADTENEDAWHWLSWQRTATSRSRLGAATWPTAPRTLACTRQTSAPQEGADCRPLSLERSGLALSAPRHALSILLLPSRQRLRAHIVQHRPQAALAAGVSQPLSARPTRAVRLSRLMRCGMIEADGDGVPR